MIQDMTPIQRFQEPTVHDLQDPNEMRPGAAESWRDIADQYRADHTGPDSVLYAVENLLLELGDSLSDRADRDASAGRPALARRNARYARRVYELYRQAETPAQSQMAVAALALGVPQWLFDDEDGDVWRREIAALEDYAAWAFTGGTAPRATEDAQGASTDGDADR